MRDPHRVDVEASLLRSRSEIAHLFAVSSLSGNGSGPLCVKTTVVTEIVSESRRPEVQATEHEFRADKTALADRLRVKVRGCRHSLGGTLLARIDAGLMT